MPTWHELGSALSQEHPDSDASDPIEAISAYEQAFGRPTVVRRVAELIRIPEAIPGPVHKSFCSLPFDTIITTNFDLLLEQQYEKLEKRHLPVIEETQLSIPNLYDGPTVIKFHGDVHHPHRMVLTEDDFDGFISRNPVMSTHVGSLLMQRVGVLIGYSLNDPDMRQILATIADRLGRHRPPLWALTVGETSTSVARFERRGVRVANIPTGRKKRADVLQQLFDELGEYWRSRVMRPGPTRSEPIAGTASSCLFLVPLRLRSFYSEMIYPLVREFGLEPVGPEDLTDSRGNRQAAVEAAIGRAKAVIVDVGDGTGRYELAYALSLRHEEGSVLTISEPNRLLEDLGSLREAPYITRPRDPLQTTETFRDELAGWLRETASSVSTREVLEPQRLLEAHEPRAAIVMAFSLLETALRQRWGISGNQSMRPSSQREMFNVLRSEGIVTDHRTMLRLDDHLRLRNEIVHSGSQVSEAQARQVLEDLLPILKAVADGSWPHDL